MTVAAVVADIAPILSLLTPYLVGGIAFAVAYKLAPRLKSLFK